VPPALFWLRCCDSNMGNYLLTLLIFVPTVGAAALLMTASRQALRWVALGTTLAAFVLSSLLLCGYTFANNGSPQMVADAVWIPAFNVHYKVGIDGLSFPLVILTTFIFVLAVIASWNIDKMLKGYLALLLFLETAILGVFLSLDFFLFYVFFELSLLPMYFVIGIWGGPRRQYAAIKFLLYTLVGSIGLLIALIGIYLRSKQIIPSSPGSPGGTFDLIMLASPAFQVKLAPLIGGLGGGVAKSFFLLLMFGFLVKVPAIPLHSWLPDAHVEAPTPVSMILAALMLKMGGYGILRIAYPLFPEAGKAMWELIAIIGVVSIIYGALCAMSQTDFKRLVAYSSISHMGLVTLGVAMMTPLGVNGAIFMMVAHGVISAMMFFVVGVVYDRAHHRDLNRFGGLATTMPIYTGFSALACFANLGLPGLCGFVGEIMVLLGAFQAARGDSILVHDGFATGRQIYPLAIIACFGTVLTAGYILWTIQRVFFGPVKPEYAALPDLDAREVAVLTPLAVMTILLGVLPTFFVLVLTNPAVTAMFRLFS
jgi:NADH-quinone oxidoreductase subunit M